MIENSKGTKIMQQKAPSSCPFPSHLSSSPEVNTITGVFCRRREVHLEEHLCLYVCACVWIEIYRESICLRITIYIYLSFNYLETEGEGVYFFYPK